MLQRIVFVFLMAPWVLEISSFSPLTRSAFRIKSALKVAYNTFVTVDSTFETPCSLIADEGVSLSDYMKLPVDQYVCIKMPLDATLERIDGAKFNMTVPPVRFFTLDVSPTIICDVGQSNEFVTIESSDCTLRGSPYVEALNGCYRLKISSTFTWFDSPGKKTITSRSIIGLDVDPPAPFKYFGKSILETTGRLAMSIALSEIGNAFVQALADDYQKWATSETYRIERAGGMCHVDTEQLDDEDELLYMPSKQLKESEISEIASKIAALAMEEQEIVLSDVVTKNSLPVLTDDICLFPGSEPIVRVEEAPSNARRIFTGVDIMADMESIWEVLTAFERLQDVVPSLVKNEVVFRTAEGGARLAQVGGAKVLPGVTFTAKTVLDVNVYKEDNPLPDHMLALDTTNGASSADVRAFGKALPLQRGVFPRPYSITQLPHRDITMQNVLGSGDFDHYQGVWRMQSLPNCAPNGGDASRLTYAVEIKPKGILPVKLIEGRIASDLKANMAAIRAYVEAAEKKKSRPTVIVPQQMFTIESAAANEVTEISASVEQSEIVYSPSLLSLDVDNRLQIPVLHKDKPKKSILRKISNYLIGNWEDDSTSVTGIVEKAESTRHASTLPRLLDSRVSSSSPVSLTDSTKDTMVLLEENDRLKERVAYLEGEMAKASMVLRKIEMLSKLD